MASMAVVLVRRRKSHATGLLQVAQVRWSRRRPGPACWSRGPVMAKIGNAQFVQRRQQADDFFGFAALRKDQHHVVAVDAAQIAMHRLGRMEPVARRAGRCQRGHDFLSDHPRFAHAGNDYVSPALVQQFYGLAKLAVQPVGHLSKGPAFDLDDLPGVTELFEGAEIPDRACASVLIIPSSLTEAYIL